MTTGMSTSTGQCGHGAISGYLHAADGAALDQRLDALAARRVPTIRAPRSSAAPMPPGRWRRGEATLACQCGQTSAQPRRSERRSHAAVIHVLAEQATLDGTVISPGTARLRDPARRVGARVAAPRSCSRWGPTDATPEPGYRPTAKTMEFIRWRDLTCRWPGCDRPVDKCDVDHTMLYPAGLTHASDLKHYCRVHHLVKTF